jgi:hypothetical protein
MPLKISAQFSRQHGNLKVGIYSQALRCVRKFEFPDSLWPGERTLDVQASDLAGLASGSYYYVITAKDRGTAAKSAIRCVVILK